MKKMHLLFAGAFAALAVVACSDDEIESGTEYDEAWYAANATISSSDSHFSLTEDGEGVISFKTEGGSVTVNVDCGTEWTAENSASDIFGCSVQSAGITVNAEQNLVEEELNGTITLMTSESKIQFATISVTQNAYGAPEITVTANEWHVPADMKRIIKSNNIERSAAKAKYRQGAKIVLFQFDKDDERIRLDLLKLKRKGYSVLYFFTDEEKVRKL